MPENPTFGKSVDFDFISPDIRDKLVYIDVDGRNGSYAPLAYGTAHPNATNPDTQGRTYPNHVLVHQMAKKGDDTIVRRWYSNLRLDQEEHNYSIEYPHGSTSYPQVVRTYIVPRSTYAAIAPGTADPVFGTLGLIGQQLGKSDSIEIDSYFVLHRRIFGRLPTPTLTGQEYIPLFDFTAPFTERFVAAGSSIGNARTETTPIDTIQEKERVYTVPTAELNAYEESYASFENLDLPDVLNSITVVWGGGGGAGSYDENATGAATGTPAQLQLALNGSAHSSAAVAPQLIFDIDSPQGSKIPCTDYYFFTTNPTHGAILARLTSIIGSTVEAWPRFKPKRHNLICAGQKIAVAVRVAAQCAVYINATAANFAVSEGTGEDFDFGLSIQTVDLPPTIHGLINLTGDTTLAVSIGATAAVDTPSGTNWPGASASKSASAQAEGEVTPTSFAATTPAAIPSSGRYLVDVVHEPYRFGYSGVRARVLNAADID